MNRKKIIIFTMLTFTMLGICGYSKANEQPADKETETEKGIEINAENFPSEYVRELVSESFDSNNDNQLSQNEIDAVTELWIDPDDTYTYMDGLDNSNYKYSVIDCKGLEIFRNVKKLWICAETVEHNDEKIKKYGLLNFENLYALKKVEDLYISGEKYEARYELNQFPNLKKVKFAYIKNLKQLEFGDNSRIEQINLVSVYGNYKLDLSKTKQLKKFRARGLNCNGIKFGKNDNLRKIYMEEMGKGIKNIDVSKLSNLKTLDLNYSKYLKNINVKQVKNLYLYKCKRIKKLDISKCNKVKRVIVISTGINNVCISEKLKINDLCISFNKIKDIDLTNMKIQSLSLQGNPIKNIDLTQVKKIDEISIDKSQNIKTRANQDIKIIRW